MNRVFVFLICSCLICTTILGAEPFISSITPDSGPVTGGTVVTLRGGGFSQDPCGNLDPGICLTQTGLWFGETRVLYQVLDDARITATTPAHLPATTDVTVGGFSWRASLKQAFTFVGKPGDAFERILIPVLLPPVTGVFGSEFRTVLRLGNKGTANSIPLFGLVIDCGSCGPVDPMDNPLTVVSGQYLYGDDAHVLMNGSPGRLVFVLRDRAKDLAANLRVYDVSRTDTNAGTELPIIRDSDFQAGTIVLLGTPIDSRYRNRLRIYSPEPGVEVLARVTVGVVSTVVALRPGSGLFDPAYAEFTGFPSGAAVNNGSATIPVAVESLTPNARLWAFISVTNNETQQVTTISP